MAGQTVKEILLKFGIDNSNWKKAIQELATLLESANKNAAKQQAQAQKSLEAQKQKIQEIKNAQKEASAVIDKQIAQQDLLIAKQKGLRAAVEAKVAQEKLAAVELTKQKAEKSVLQATERAIQAEVNSRLLREKLLTAEINRQTASLRQQAVVARTEAQKKRGGGEGGGGRGFGGGILGGFASGLFGGGPFGMIAGAVASAEGFEHALELALEKLKEFSKEVGPLQQVREQFEKLAASRGINDPVKFIGDLREATHGLVNDMQLYRNANTFMQSSIHASNDDIIQLTKATVGLARAQGRDATEAVQSLQRFFLTGRSMTLAYATGINRAYLQVGSLGHATDATIKTQIQFKQALEAVTEQYKMIGEPAETYTEKLEKVGVASYRVLEELMLGLERSKGFQIFLEQLDNLTQKLGEFAEKAASYGEKLGPAFVILGNVFSVVTDSAEGLVTTLVNGATVVIELANAVLGFVVALNQGSSGLKSFQESSHPVVAFFTYLSIGIQTAISGLKLFADFFVTVIKMIVGGLQETLDIIKDPSWANWKKFFSSKKELEEWKAFTDQVKRDNKELEDSIAGKMDRLAGLDRGNAGDFKIKFSAPAELFTDQQRIDAEKKYAKIKEQIAIETSKIELEQTKMRIANEQELVKVQYDQGLLSHADFLNKKRALDKQEIDARLKDANTEYAAKSQALATELGQTRQLAEEKQVNAALDRQTRLTNLDIQRQEVSDRIEASKTLTDQQKADKLNALGNQWNALQKLINNSYSAAMKVAGAEIAEVQAKELVEAKKHQLELVKIRNDGAKQERQITEEEINDEISARKQLIDVEARLQQAAIQRRKQVLEKDFQEGLVSSNEYLEARVKDIEEEYATATAAATEKLNKDKLSQVAIAEYHKAIAEADIKREKALTDLTDKEWDLRVQAAQKATDRIKNILEGQLKYQEELQKLDPLTGRTQQVDILQKLIALEQQRLEIQKQQAKALEDAGMIGSETWSKVYAEIAKTQTQLLQYNQQLLKAKDYSDALATSAKNIASAAALFPKGGAKVSEAFNKFAQVTETLSKLRQDFNQGLFARRTKVVAPTTPEDVYKSLKKESEAASSSLKKSLDEAGAAAKKSANEVVGNEASLSKAIKDQTQEIKNQVQSANALITAQQNTTKATNDFATALVKATGAVSGATSSASGHLPPGFKPSGPSTPSSPTGTLTDSDVQDLDVTMTSGVPGQQGAAALAASLAALVPAITPVTSAFQKLGAEFTNTLGSNGLFGAIKQMFGGGDSGQASSSSDKFKNFMSGAQQVAGGIGGMMSAAKGTGGPMQAGLTGMAAGMQLGMLAGPVGAAVGAGVGLITGVFSGKAEKQSEKIAKQIVAKFNAVLDEVNTGTKTLASGVQAEIANIQMAVDSLSHRKGGRDQLKNILPDMESKLQQLKDQQKQVITSFDTTLEQLRAPQAYQETVGQVEQIIQKYQDYVNAGGNVAQANQFLQLSFQNLVQNGLEQLNQDEENAINNALQYNDLLLQRQDLIQSTNLQIQQIMSQGVAVRQMPEGVSKAVQIQQLMRTNAAQLDRLNEEISVSNHKLNIEQKIFGLATTRIGLETQLVALQDAQADKDDKQALALQKVVAAYAAGVPTNLSTALNQLGLGSAFIPITAEPALVPVAPVHTGIADVDLQNQLEYQQALQYYQQQTALGLSNTRTTSPLGILSGMGVTAGDSSTLSTLLNGAQSLPQALQQLFQDPNTVVNVASEALTSLAQTVAKMVGVTATPVQPTPPISSPIAATAPVPAPIRASALSIQPQGTAQASSILAAQAMTHIATQTNTQVVAATQRLQVESSISQLSDMRVVNEVALTKMKMQEIALDMQRVQLHNDLLTRTQTWGSRATSLEIQLQKVYDNRGRQGFGKFYGEIANPT